MISLTYEVKDSYEREKFYCICKKRFTIDNENIRDHCHFAGKYRGAIHSKCNMKFKISKNIPVCFS